ncbi:Metal-dependent phosphohydrolase, HD subdomain [hydrothermal vent metagenome]|uniref:Metal-dependent phosphohydrolase, HD subdomain n=1 Tax=hydrothermal vent metagenome TaxID=652676 RepID=A0A3B0VP53_9ZZZZ
MADGEIRISIDKLIEIVQSGGKIRTGVDVFNKQGRLILERDVLVADVAPLLRVKKFGVELISIVSGGDGGLWDESGQPVVVKTEAAPSSKPAPASKPQPVSEIDRRIHDIEELRRAAAEKASLAKKSLKNALRQIQETGGNFDFEPIDDTVRDLFGFISQNETAFSYLTREIFSYDQYLYNHSLNVCVIGTVVMKKFNENFNAMVNNHLNSVPTSITAAATKAGPQAFKYFQDDELQDISAGFFMHDMGKMLVEKSILNKKGRLSKSEFEVVKTHSTINGIKILEKNHLINPYLCKISRYHHARLFEDEERCYPAEISPLNIPAYVKVCKLADIFDAMTSKRCYKEALNPVGVVADIFHKYAQKDTLLQFILHAFVRAVGIYPSGSVVSLINGQLAYVLDSEGPALIAFTDADGRPLTAKQDIMVLDKKAAERGLKIDRRKAPMDPVQAHKILPDYLKSP